MNETRTNSSRVHSKSYQPFIFIHPFFVWEKMCSILHISSSSFCSLLQVIIADVFISDSQQKWQKTKDGRKEPRSALITDIILESRSVIAFSSGLLEAFSRVFFSSDRDVASCVSSADLKSGQWLTIVECHFQEFALERELGVTVEGIKLIKGRISD